MAINLKIVIIVIVIGVLAVGGAGYFYFFQVKKAEAPKEDITKVTGSATGKVEVIGREKFEEEKKEEFSDVLSELRKKIEGVRLRGSFAPGPVSPEGLKPVEEIGFESAVPAGEKQPEVKVFENKARESGISGPESAEKSSFPLPSQFSSGQEYKNSLVKKYTSSHIATLKKLQDDLIAGGRMKESDRSDLGNEKEITDFWRKYFGYLVTTQDLNPADREKLLETLNNPLTQIKGVGVEGYSGGESAMPVASRVANSIADRFEFSTAVNFSEEEIVRHFYPVSYLNGLSSRQEDLVSAGFIKSVEKVVFKTRKEVEWLNLKIIDYEYSKGNLTEEEKAKAIEAITKTMAQLQQTELDNIMRMKQAKSEASGSVSKIFSFIDFSLLPGIVDAKKNSQINGGLFVRFAGLFDFLKPIFMDFGMAGNIFFGVPRAIADEIDIDDSCITYPNINYANWVPTTENLCYRSLLYDADPYKANDPRACVCWSKKLFSFKCDSSYKDIPPGHCDIPGPGWMYPDNRCFALKSCIRDGTPTIEPTGCYISCPLNLIWDKITTLCGCSP
ncbi:MAG: hypothetical protein A3G49_02625 [Candidatus Sungbacteria bacterium RIFCSPLOWO2_12_FULL_41_11]|uniref:Uncharacterized protein n=1 Tax=Candidatus Sungbacteria bacterium RIFCSPLOWO2_12_FULL_41_11 TaxID=1802286 RepID=A0A1G2LQ64_9BACT|nr:MAG: hypothetical protein UV01_C0001G0147 [Parcubacteria group bacterium GW2011_GWA2_42_14]OGZ99846.1 MAG: hypothetical protein A3D41_04725 [Candidatus Sungbacteria bacterium RIFCSPHIGHO2_02_FULL_41_12b]OHA13778.1 MAG: hypothetical protein A3G49_02625 [Candidatus Sungbacteria bacterium RIFCSPLOWO2_12_FULL_41_11]